MNFATLQASEGHTYMYLLYKKTILHESFDLKRKRPCMQEASTFNLRSTSSKGSYKLKILEESPVSCTKIDIYERTMSLNNLNNKETCLHDNLNSQNNSLEHVIRYTLSSQPNSLASLTGCNDSITQNNVSNHSQVPNKLFKVTRAHLVPKFELKKEQLHYPTTSTQHFHIIRPEQYEKMARGEY